VRSSYRVIIVRIDGSLRLDSSLVNYVMPYSKSSLLLIFFSNTDSVVRLSYIKLCKILSLRETV
jgi:hypothetical protein